MFCERKESEKERERRACYKNTLNFFCLQRRYFPRLLTVTSSIALSSSFMEDRASISCSVRPLMLSRTACWNSDDDDDDDASCSTLLELDPERVGGAESPQAPLPTSILCKQ